MDVEPTDALTDFPTTVTLPVQWGDQDAFGHVNNTVYLRWFESARYLSRRARHFANESLSAASALSTSRY